MFVFVQGENVKEQSRAYKYLAHFYLKRRMLDDAYTAAQKCYEFTEVLVYIAFIMPSARISVYVICTLVCDTKLKDSHF